MTTGHDQPIQYRGKRWVRATGIVVLGVCVLLIVLGSTVVDKRLAPEWQLLFWGVCMACACLAIFIALVDVVLLARATRQQRRELLDSTLSGRQSEDDGDN